MSSFEDIANIKHLQQLLQQPDEKSDSDEEDEHLPATGVHRFGPGNIGAPSKGGTTYFAGGPNNSSSSEPYKNVYAKTVEPPPSSIEEWQERQEREDSDALDSRKQPQYSITYKQNVTTEDVFLQMGNKTGATSSCDQMLLTVDMPEETVTIDRMELAVRKHEIDLQSPVYRLKLALPQPVDPDAGSAKYDSEAKRMTLLLKMVREYDYVNF